jgi:DNA polymerase-3 subunit beta
MPTATVSQTTLVQAMKELHQIATGKASNPLLAYVLVEADKVAERLRLTTTNREEGVMLTVCVPAAAMEDWSLVVPCRLLEAAIADLTGDVTLEMESDTSCSALRILQPGSATRVKECFSGDEFYLLPRTDAPAATSLMVEGASLAHAVTLVVTTAKDAPYQALGGVNVEVEGTQITLAATDGYRLGYTSLDASTLFGEGTHVLVPASSLRALVHLLPPKDHVPVRFVSWQVDGYPPPAQALFSWENHQLVVNLIRDDIFPDWRKAVPKDIKSVYSLSADDLATRLSALYKLAKKGNRMLTMDFTRPGELELIYNDSEMDISRVVPATLVEGTHMERIVVQLPYLLAAAKTFRGRAVELHLEGPQFPLRITDVQPDEEPYETVLQPMYIESSKKPVIDARSVLYPPENSIG